MERQDLEAQGEDEDSSAGEGREEDPPHDLQIDAQQTPADEDPLMAVPPHLHGESLKAWQSQQCRSKYDIPLVRRKFDSKTGRVLHWLAEVRKPTREVAMVQNARRMEFAKRKYPQLSEQQIRETKGKEIRVRGTLEFRQSFETDIEAEVAATVIAILYEDYVAEMRERFDPEKRRPRKKVTKRFPVACRWLIDNRVQRLGTPRPDPTFDDQVRDFAGKCSLDFKAIAQDAARDNQGVCPHADLQCAVDAYLRMSWRYDRFYKDDEIPRPKQRSKTTREGVLRKPVLVPQKKAQRRRKSVIELECCCDLHASVGEGARFIRWEVDEDLCSLFSSDATFRLTLI